ncbi:MAG: hypothetical protein LBJ11_00805 [Oscillospiraceae bacterium]|jgi:hypothetical protein|nr:hypothetical protein [Oscillospiraceae bacterium]
MPLANDGDMKIFTPAGKPASEDLDLLAEQSEELRASGELGGARALGQELAGMSAQSPLLQDLTVHFGVSLDERREQQLHVLMVFAGQTALRRVLDRPILTDAAVNAMHDTLIETSGSFWETIADGSAFTQYLLALRAGRASADQAVEVGEAFARLCGQEDNPDLRALGAEVFLSAQTLVATKWAQRETPEAIR